MELRREEKNDDAFAFSTDDGANQPVLRANFNMTPDDVEKALEERAKNFWWVFSLFILTSAPGILNAAHINSYVFLADSPESFWCQIPVLSEANWTDGQIRTVSSTNPNSTESCSYYNWNYTLLRDLGFDDALQYVTTHSKPNEVPCESYKYIEDIASVVSEWNLVCSNAEMRSVVQVAVAIGKFAGAFCFGPLADKFGRKPIFTLACILYMLSSPAAAISNSFALLLAMRVLIGVAGAGCYEVGYTILSEMTLNYYRTSFGSLYNISYAFGTIFLPIVAYYSSTWRILQFSLSIPGFLLIINCWFVPESPRWLIGKKRYREAWIVLKGNHDVNVSEHSEVSSDENDTSRGLKVCHPLYKQIISVTVKLFKLFSTWELFKRVMICYYGWFVASFAYFVIALNGANFSFNKYIYVALNGVVEIPGYFLPIVLFSIMGRKLAGISLFIIGGVALLLILVIPQGTPVVTVALIGRLCVAAVFAEVILHTSELFPTAVRNTAMGTSLTMSQLGTILAPFVVDILGRKAWYIPSTLIGVLCLIGALLTFFLPETKNKPMLETIDDVKRSAPNMKVSCANFCNFT